MLPSRTGYKHKRPSEETKTTQETTATDRSAASTYHPALQEDASMAEGEQK